MAPGGGSDATERPRVLLRAWAYVVVWIGVVMLLSQDAFSLSSSSRFLTPLLLAIGVPDAHLPLAHFFVRKTAHVVTYAVLACLAARAAALSVPMRAALATAVGLSLTVACADEWNQLYQPRRTGTQNDVALDFVGSLLGAWVWRTAERRRSPGGPAPSS